MEKLEFILEEDKVSFFPVYYTWIGFADARFKDYVGEYLDTSACEFHDDYLKWAANSEKWARLGSKVLEGIKSGRIKTRELKKKTLEVGDALFKECDRILSEKNLNKTIGQLVEEVERLYLLSKDLAFYGVIAVASDYHHFVLSNELDRIVRKKISERGLEKKAQEYLSMLISPNELNAVKEESIALMEIAWEISKSRKEFESLNELQESIENSAEFKKKLQEHTKRFFWINYGYRGPAYSDEEFINAIFEAFKNQMNLGEELKKLKNAPVELEKMQAAYLAELQLKESDLLLVESAKDFLFMKMYRIDVRHKTNFTLDVIFEALSEKIGLSKEDLRNSMMDEIRSYIEGISSAKKKELEQRREYFVALLDKGRLSFFYGKDARKFVAMHIIEKQQKEAESVSEIRGQSACPGKASGPVKIVLRVEDIHKVERGDVLVAIMTIPDFVPAMAKAVAFVTDTGGITCHAAIVAREMSKPCIVGARNATKVLKEGEIIEVDATHGIVRKIGARAQQVV